MEHGIPSLHNIQSRFLKPLILQRRDNILLGVPDSVKICGLSLPCTAYPCYTKHPPPPRVAVRRWNQGGGRLGTSTEFGAGTPCQLRGAAAEGSARS